MHVKNKIFPHPAVEYIPLPFNQLEEGINNHGSLIQLRAEKYPEKLGKYTQKIENPSQEECLYLLLKNVRILLVKYRAYNIILLGEEKNHYFQLGTLPCKYFYKNPLSLILYNREGKKLAQESCTIKPW